MLEMKLDEGQEVENLVVDKQTGPDYSLAMVAVHPTPTHFHPTTSEVRIRSDNIAVLEASTEPLSDSKAKPTSHD